MIQFDFNSQAYNLIQFDINLMGYILGTVHGRVSQGKNILK